MAVRVRGECPYNIIIILLLKVLDVGQVAVRGQPGLGQPVGVRLRPGHGRADAEAQVSGEKPELHLQQGWNALHKIFL